MTNTKRKKAPAEVLETLKKVQPLLEASLDDVEDILDDYELSAQSIRGIAGTQKEVDKALKSLASAIVVLQMETT